MVYGKGCKGNYNTIIKLVKKFPFFPMVKNKRSMVHIDNLVSFIKMTIDEELDGLFQLQATQVDFAERQATFHQISKLMFDQVYWLGVWQDPDTWAIGPRLQNVKISGSTPFFNIYEWDMTP